MSRTSADSLAKLEKASPNVRALFERIEARVGRGIAETAVWGRDGVSFNEPDGRLRVRVDPKQDWLAVRLGADRSGAFPARVFDHYAGAKQSGWMRIEPRDDEAVSALLATIG